MKPGTKSQLTIAAWLAAWALLAGGSYYAWKIWLATDNSASGHQTVEVRRGDIVDTITATGTLQPKNYVDVGTQVSGQLKKLLVEVSAMVEAGQLLAEIDPSVYQYKVDANRAQLLNQSAQIADRQAQLALAKLQFARQENLVKDNATTTEALQRAEATYSSALAQVDAHRAQRQQTASTLRGDEANLGYTRLYAPIAGTVVSQAAKQGQTLNANLQAPIIMRIADLSTMTVQALVSEVDVAKLRLGMDVYFTTLGGDNRIFFGNLNQIAPMPIVANKAIFYNALFDVRNPDRLLMTQMTAQVIFVVSRTKDAVLVPRAALRPAPAASRTPSASDDIGIVPRTSFAGGRALVDVIGSDGKSEEREVKIGVINRGMAQIESGLAPGEVVAIVPEPTLARAP